MWQAIFSGVVDVKIESNGDAMTLEMLHPDYAEYNLMSFIKPTVVIRDYRNSGIRAVAKYCFLEQITKHSFWRCFCSPAIVSIEAKDKRELIISLNETSYYLPENVLWAAIGIKNLVPAFDYCLEPWVSEIDDDHIGFLSVYRKPN
jgi:hypothetical protein